MSIIIFIIILLVLVLVHEFGHFSAAKMFGIRVDEFGFGFPPKIFSKKFGETEYSLNLLPIGGFVKIFGENPDEENILGPDSGRSFVNKKAWQQAVVLFAGVLMNFLLAWLLFSIGFISGLPTSVGSEPTGSHIDNVKLTILSVLPKSPAEKAGLRVGDKIVDFSLLGHGNFYLDEPIAFHPDDLKNFIVSNKGKDIKIIYTRGADKKENVASLTPSLNPNGVPMIGISMDDIGILKLPFFSAFVEGFKLTVYTIKSTFMGLFGLISQLFHGKGSLDSVTGPVGLASVVGEAYKFGFIYLLSFMALISVNLGVINLLPFPALDGGRLFILLIEKIKGSPINPKIVNAINLVGFVVLILLMIFITYHDIVKLF